MTKLLVLFSGWLECDMATLLADPQSGDVHTVQEWLDIKDNIDGLILDSFHDCMDECLDMAYRDLDLSIED